MLEADYVLGLGSNLGSRRANIDVGLELLAATPGCSVTSVSALYDSEPVGPPQPRYLNGAARVSSDLPPLALLDRLLAIEAQLGRNREQRGERWGARTLDLDILWAAQSMRDARLLIPHPRLLERWFALAPLLEVAPELRAEYGGRLRALSEPLGPLHTHIAAPVIATVHESAGPAYVVSASAADVPDAFAAALTALGRALAEEHGCGKTEAQVLLGECAPGAELETLLRRALELVASGVALRRAALCELASGRFDARIVGRPGATTDFRAATTAVTCAVQPGSARVEITLAG